MESTNTGISLLPPDVELMRRDELFMHLSEKYNVDEGPDAELVDETPLGCDDGDGSGSGSSYSVASGGESEVEYDLEQIHQELLAAIEKRVNVWPEKGIHFRIATVDRSLSVGEWLEANQEFTTSTKKTVTTSTITTDGTTTTISSTTESTIRKKFVGNADVFRLNEGVDTASVGAEGYANDDSDTDGDDDVLLTSWS